MQCIANIDNDSDVSRLNRGQLCSYAAAHVGLSFASTPSPYLYADDLQDSSAEIAAVRLLPGGSTTSKNRISLPPFSGVTHISIMASADTTLPSHQHRRGISNRSSTSKNVCSIILSTLVARLTFLVHVFPTSSLLWYLAQAMLHMDSKLDALCNIPRSVSHCAYSTPS